MRSQVRAWSAVGANPVHDRLFCESSWCRPGSEVRIRTAVPPPLPWWTTIQHWLGGGFRRWGLRCLAPTGIRLSTMCLILLSLLYLPVVTFYVFYVARIIWFCAPPSPPWMIVKRLRELLGREILYSTTSWELFLRLQMCSNWDNNFYTPPHLGGGGGV